MHFYIVNRFLDFLCTSTPVDYQKMSQLPVLRSRSKLYQSCGNRHDPSQTSRNPSHSNAFACWHKSKRARVKDCSIENGNLQVNSEKDEQNHRYVLGSGSHISMCVAFVGLCLFKEPLLCSRCSTAMHLELPQMFTVVLTTLLGCV